MINISVTIIAQNADETIENTLKSLTQFDEVLLYLNNSTDNTNIIANQYKNVKIVYGDFLGFGDSKNKAVSFTKNDWILSIDSDEIISDNLLEELKILSLEDNNEVFTLKRENYFLGKKVKYSGWGKDYLVRIYNKNRYSFNSNMVHEYIVLNAKTKNTILKNSFKHDAVQKISQQLQKIDKYSELYSNEKKCIKYSSPLVATVNALFFFIKIYIFKLGILDGYAGYLISISGANGVFYKYMKLYEKNKKCK